MEENPYAPSQVSPIIHTTSQGDVVISPAALAATISTQFWVKCVGILMLISIVFQLFDAFTENNVSSSNLSGPGLGGAEGLFVILSLTLVLFYIMLAIRLLQYGKAISALAISRNPHDFETAMTLQTKFWKLASILTIIILVLLIFIWFSLAASYY